MSIVNGINIRRPLRQLPDPMTYRLAITYDTPCGDFIGAWRAVKCWPVNDAWASRAVEVDRRYQVKRLRLISAVPIREGLVNPRLILNDYLASLPESVKVERCKT